MTEHQGAVLVVDDEPANTDMLARRLTRYRYQVDVANSGREALAKLEERAYDVTLLDVMMPGMNGFEVLEQIRKGDDCIDMPVIMVTALADAFEVVHALKCGADDYVTKPVDFPVLMARVRAQVMKHQAHAELNRLNAQLNETVERRTRKLEQTQNVLADVVDSLPVIIWRASLPEDRPADIHFLAGDVTGILGLERDSVIEQPQLLLGRLYEEDLPRMREALERMIDDTGHRVLQVRLKSADGMDKWIHVGARARDSESRDFIGVALDTSTSA